MSVTIRPAAETDLPAIGRLGAMLVQLHHDFDAERFIPATDDTPRGYASWLGSQLAQPAVLLLVAEQHGQVVGYSYSALEGFDYQSLRGPAGAIHDILVDPLCRGSGIGSALLRATIAALAAKGAPRVVLSTAARNESAQRLFAREGFRQTMIEMTRESGH
ncbi:MAG: acetyltransferase [Gemmatimonadetes bacterium]|nr:acetyltransferase [Gemmatimonadota bacterium]